MAHGSQLDIRFGTRPVTEPHARGHMRIVNVAGEKKRVAKRTSVSLVHLPPRLDFEC